MSKELSVQMKKGCDKKPLIYPWKQYVEALGLTVFLGCPAAEIVLIKRSLYTWKASALL